jgi:hypothetical protein
LASKRFCEIMGREGALAMRHAILALALAAISSTAQAKITELLCSTDDGRQWAVSTDDESRRATITHLKDNTVSADLRAAFTPDDVRIAWGDNYYFVIDRTTLGFKAGSYGESSNPTRGSCRISQRANRKF